LSISSFCDLVVGYFIFSTIELKPDIPGYDILHLPQDYSNQALA
jgi:hypothetical protein